MKNMLNTGIWLAVITGLLVCLGFAGAEQNRKVCNGIDVFIEQDHDNFFVDEADILSILENKGDTIVGKALRNINYDGLEKLILKNPSVEKVEVYAGIEGKLNVSVKQRKPIIRIFNHKNESFYVDNYGKLMPLSDKYTSRVLIANGNIHANYMQMYAEDLSELASIDSLSKKTLLDDIYLIAKHIDNDEFWKAQIQQIWVSDEDEIFLIPRVGNHKIILGDVTDLKRKLKKLKVFYTEGLNKTGWNQYSIINLKYKNQVICTKR